MNLSNYQPAVHDRLLISSSRNWTPDTFTEVTVVDITPDKEIVLLRYLDGSKVWTRRSAFNVNSILFHDDTTIS